MSTATERGALDRASHSSTVGPSPSGSYGRLIARRMGILAVALGALAVLSLADILIGPAFLGVGEVLNTIFAPQTADKTTQAIVYAIRLPMTCMAILVGAGLGIAGTHMQTILGNPLASPFTLGFSAAAGFGAAAVILLGVSLPMLPHLTIPVAAFVMAALAAVTVFGFSRIRGMSAEVMVLAGIATMFLFQSLQSMVQYLASPEVLQQIVFWLFGSLLKANWSNVGITAVIVLFGAVALVPDFWRLTALRLGDDRASAIGVDVRHLRMRVFAVVALLTAGAVSFVGTIGFVGLVAPHIARMLVGEDQRILVPMAAAMGAIIMVGSSIVSKILSPGTVVPIGIVTAVIGVPFLYFLILDRRRRLW
ncbi:iron ABC transporter permease [Hwanghaeella grinnelliae]|uniref:Iron ABC transporter permease n=1 Tax=Hwanghaeella grinnelliae TaxID=2500179 RepID=A0A3S2Y0G3_9PROT|nr:iron ABC transporter permease [Hwanghaeella grinnelliae]RVU34065.1 iron ABC transporter permease [Hwanghaeella grinnelliae]